MELEERGKRQALEQESKGNPSSLEALSSAFLTRLAHTADFALLLEDESGKIILLNKPFCELFNLKNSPEAFLGLDREEIVRLVPGLFPNAKLPFHLAAPGKPCATITETARRADGRLFRWEYVPVWQEEKRMGAMWVFKDILEQEGVVGTLEREQERGEMVYFEAGENGSTILDQENGLFQLKVTSFVRQIIDASPNPVYVKDQQGKFILVNEAYADLHGKSVAEFCQKDIFCHDFSFDRDLETLASGTTATFEEFFKTTDGRKIWFSTIKKVFVRPNGSSYLMSVSSDITDLKHAQQLAEDSSKAKENFLANMSHEIRTPMHAILGMANLLKYSSLSPQQREYVDVMVSSADHLLFMLNDILDFAKINSGKIELECISFDLAQAIRKSLSTLMFKAAEKGLLLHFEEPPGSLPVVEGDPHRLSQVLLNLIANAIKFTHEGGVVVSAMVKEEPDQMLLAPHQINVEFCVHDSGIGLSAEKVDFVFESFNQAYSNTSRQYGGTGLGLSICKSLVELQGGRIWVESEPGRGSKFYFTLPYRVSETKPTALLEERKRFPRGLLKGLQVLLVEDNEVNQFLALSLLQSWEVKADVASDGQQALRLASGKKYDLILMDVQMPVMNGIEATVRIRENQNPNHHTPIIALTANALKTSVESQYLAGFTDYLTKPFDEAKLYDKIARNTGREFEKGIGAGAVESEGKAKEQGGERQGGLDPNRVEEKLYDLSELGSLAQNESFVRQMLQLFVETVPTELSDLEAALRAGNRETVRKLSHRLKSTYGNFGIKKAASLMRTIEKEAEIQADFQTLILLLEEVKVLSRAVMEQLQEQL